MQTRKVDEVVLVDSSSQDQTVPLARQFDFIKILNIDNKDFNHGGTRDAAIQASSGDFILCLTQDALPVDEFYVERLVSPLEQDASVAMASGRQIAKPDASLSEKLTREFNYPNVNFVRDKKDLPYLGIKTFFASNCCSAYRRSTYDAIGGFDKNILVNEDMKIAAQFIFAGYKIAYVGDASVLHSHNYSLLQQCARNFDVAAFMAMNADLFKGVSATSEGFRMVKWVLSQMLLHGHFFAAAHYVLECAFKYYGNCIGEHYRQLSLSKVLHYSMHKKFWKQMEWRGA